MKLRQLSTVSLALLAFLAPAAQATTNWTGAVSNDWQDGGNWSAGLPTTTENAVVFVNNATVELSSNSPAVGAAKDVYLQSNATLTVSNGADLDAASLTAGTAGAGHFVFTGVGTTATLRGFVASDIYVSNGSSMVIKDGAVVTTTTGQTYEFDLDGDSTLTLSGGGVLATTGIRSADNDLINFDGGVFKALANNSDVFKGFAAGDVTLQSGGGYIDTNGFAITITSSMDGTGGLTKQGAGTLTLTGANTYTGTTTIEKGTLAVDGAAASYNFAGGVVRVGDGAGTSGRLEVLNGGLVKVDYSVVGYGNGQGEVLVSGTNSSWQNGTNLFIGSSGTGEVTVSNGGSVSAAFVDVGGFSNASATGTLLVTGAGSQFSATSTMRVGSTADGTVTVADDGVLNVAGGAGTVELARSGSAGAGTLNVGNGAGAGIVNAARVQGVSGGGTATLNFNHTDADYHFTKDGTSTGTAVTIEGTTIVNLIGSGKTTLKSANTYTGGTVLDAGTLVIGNNGALGTGTLTINGGTLASAAPRAVANDIVVNGDFNIFPGGTLVTFSAFALNGSVDLTGGMRTITNTSDFNNAQFGEVAFGGVISNGGVHFASDLSLPQPNVVFFRLNGTAANTYTGDTIVGEDVSLQLSKTAGVTAIAGNVTGETNSVLVVANSEQIADTSTITLQGTASLQLGVFSDVTETIGTLNDDGTGQASVGLSDNTTGSKLRVGAGSFSGAIEDGVAGGVSLEKTSAGTLVLSGANTYLGDTLISAGTLQIGAGGTSGTLGAGNVVDNGTLAFNRSDDITVANAISGSGVLAQLGAGRTTLTAANTYAGGTVIRFGTLAVDGAGASISHAGAALTVGQVSGDNGKLEILNGATVLSADGVLGGDVSDSTGVATVNGTNSKWTTAAMYVGKRGTGTLNVENGGVVESATSYIGGYSGSNGHAVVTGAGSQWNNSAILYVGSSGQGLLEIRDGGRVSSLESIVGNFGATMSRVVVDNGTWNTTNALYVGMLAAGTVEISGTSQVTGTDVFIGNMAAGEVTMSGGQWTNSGSVTVGGTASGTLNLTGGKVSSASMAVGPSAGGTGVINLGTGTTAGILDTASVTGGDGTATVNFNHNQAAYYLTRDGTAGGTPVVLTGSLAVNQNGPGTTYLMGANTYSGGTVINAGTLLAGNANALGSGNVTINNTGTLGRTGAIGVTNIGGDLVFNTGSRLLVRYEDSSTLDTFKVGGATTIAPGSTFEMVIPGPYTAPAAGEVITVITSTGGVTGSFSNVVLPEAAATDFTLETESPDVNLVSQVPYPPNPAPVIVIKAAPVPFTQFAATPNEKAVANNLDQVRMENPTGDMKTVIGTLSMLPDAQALQSAFNQIAPEQLGTIARMAFNYSNTQYLNLQNRGAELRAGARGASTRGLTFFDNNGRIRPDALPLTAGETMGSHTASTDGGNKKLINILDLDNKAFEAREDNRWGAFVNGTGQFGGVDGGDNLSGYNFTTGGVTLGIDYRLMENLAIGFSTGYAGSNATVNSLGSTVGVDSARFGVYATWFDQDFPIKGEGWYADAYVGGAYNSYESDRHIAFGAINRNALATPDGLQFDSSLIGGYDFNLGSGFTFAPYGGFQYTHLGIDSYQESNASSLNLAVNSSTAESLRSNVGVTLGWRGQVGEVVLRPQVRAAWQYEFLNGIQTVNSQFANGAGALFATQVNNTVDRNTALLGAGLNADFTDNLSAFLAYDAELNGTYNVQSVNAGISIGF